MEMNLRKCMIDADSKLLRQGHGSISNTCTGRDGPDVTPFFFSFTQNGRRNYFYNMASQARGVEEGMRQDEGRTRRVWGFQLVGALSLVTLPQPRSIRLRKTTNSGSPQKTRLGTPHSPGYGSLTWSRVGVVAYEVHRCEGRNIRLRMHPLVNLLYLHSKPAGSPGLSLSRVWLEKKGVTHTAMLCKVSWLFRRLRHSLRPRFARCRVKIGGEFLLYKIAPKPMGPIVFASIIL